jgi:hypothetical protein
MKNFLTKSIVSAIALTAAVTSAHAGDGKAVWAANETSTRYGLFNGLDHRSTYGSGDFPEPFLNDDSNLEEAEFRADWLRSFKRNNHTDEFKTELEFGIGNLTLEIATSYERSVEAGTETEKGWGGVELGARYPLYQYVSKDGSFDTTFGIGIEVVIPTNTMVSKSTEVVPKIFNDTRIGKHFTIQTIVGYSMLYGDEEDGIHTLEYGTTIGYVISHDQLPIPGVQQFVPVVEIAGETQLNKEDDGVTSLTALVGFRANMNPIGKVQPRLGLGYVFPLNDVAREEQNWGLFTSLVFEF